MWVNLPFSCLGTRVHSSTDMIFKVKWLVQGHEAIIDGCWTFNIEITCRTPLGKVCWAVCLSQLMAHQAGAYLGFCSIKWLGALLPQMGLSVTGTPRLLLVPIYTPGSVGLSVLFKEASTSALVLWHFGFDNLKCFEMCVPPLVTEITIRPWHHGLMAQHWNSPKNFKIKMGFKPGPRHR
jgi:hypothetical protein